MKKLVAFVMTGMMLATACSFQDSPEKNGEKLPAPVAYSDWDRAIRTDVDMQTMFANAPARLSVR